MFVAAGGIGVGVSVNTRDNSIVGWGVKLGGAGFGVLDGVIPGGSVDVWVAPAGGPGVWVGLFPGGLIVESAFPSSPVGDA